MLTYIQFEGMERIHSTQDWVLEWLDLLHLTDVKEKGDSDGGIHLSDLLTWDHLL